MISIFHPLEESRHDLRPQGESVPWEGVSHQTGRTSRTLVIFTITTGFAPGAAGGLQAKRDYVQTELALDMALRDRDVCPSGDCLGL